MNALSPLFAIVLTLISSSAATAASVNTDWRDSPSSVSLVCTWDYIDQAKHWVENQQNHYDKFKHCSVSCFLTLRCSSAEVMLVGAAKEFADLFDDGNSELNDLYADRAGIKLVTQGKAHYDADCARQCNSLYPETRIR